MGCIGSTGGSRMPARLWIRCTTQRFHRSVKKRRVAVGGGDGFLGSDTGRGRTSLEGFWLPGVSPADIGSSSACYLARPTRCLARLPVCPVTLAAHCPDE